MIDYTLCFYKTDPKGVAVGAGAAGDYDLGDALRFRGAGNLGRGKGIAVRMQITGAGFAGGTSLQPYVKIAPDNGSGAPGTYVDGILGAAVLTAAAQTPGTMLLDIELPAQIPGEWIKVGLRTVGTVTTGAKIQGWLEDQI